MGLGRFEDGRFHLIASLRHNADQTRIDEWRASFVQASRLLFEATDGQHQIGSVTLANDSTAGLVADLWLEEPNGRSISDHLGLGRPGRHSQLFGDERFKPFIIVHELGHLLYDLFDEYTGDAGAAECVGGTTADACIMEGSFGDGDQIDAGGVVVPGRIRRFCVTSNHDPDGDTRQEARRAEACWASMGDVFDDLVVPADLPNGADQDDADVPGWVVLGSEPRFAVVLDRSGSMAGDKLVQARTGADWFVDGALDGDEVALVSYSSTASVEHGLHPMAADRSAEHAAIAALTAGGQTSIGDGLRRALEQLVSPPTASSTQAIALLTDGRHNSGEHPSSVLPDLAATLTRLFVVGVGDDLDDELLGEMAAATGGELARIDPGLPDDQQEFAIRSEIERFSALARDGGGVAAGSPERLPSGERRERASIVEPGASLATFLLSWPQAKDEVTLEVVSPSGRVVTPATVAPDVRGIRPPRPYTAVQVAQPEAGTWRTRITCRSDRPAVDLQRWAFVVNADLLGALRLPPRPVRPGGRVSADVSVSFGRRLADLRVRGRLGRRGGATTRALRFRPESEATEADGIYRAAVRAPDKPGVYAVEVAVASDPAVTRFAHGERFDGPDQAGRIPAFSRLYTGSIVVR